MTTDLVIASVSLDAMTRELLASAEWASEPRAARALLHDPRLRVVLTALHAGADMQNDDPDETVTIQSVRGSCLIAVDGIGATLEDGQLVGVPAGTRWRLVASTDAIVLVTVSRSTGPDGRAASDAGRLRS
jgi:quercetin dioxygenase-like cupin family protein